MMGSKCEAGIRRNSACFKAWQRASIGPGTATIQRSGIANPETVMVDIGEELSSTDKMQRIVRVFRPHSFTVSLVTIIAHTNIGIWWPGMKPEFDTAPSSCK